MFNRLVAVVFLLYIALSSVPLFLVAVLIWSLTRAFDRRLVWLHAFTSFWAAHYIWLMPAWKNPE